VLFHSATFLVFVTVLVALYWVTPWQRARLVLLFLSSLVFYGWRHWPSVFLLLGSIAVNYTLGRALELRKSKPLLALGITLNLAFLLFFKYGRFVVDQLIHLGALIGLQLHVPKPDAWMPLGISFFTFQVVAYLVDVYRREIPAERSLLVFAVFKSFFAQLVAGPIVRGKDLLPQLRSPVAFDGSRMHRGAWLVLCGLFLKVGVADVLGDYVDYGWTVPDTLGINNAWLVVYAYAAQLLADFWGYSTMAVGLGLCFGLTLPINFDNPYGASSLREFWRRWHITLSIWLRDYLYISLGGNRGVSKTRAAFNRLATMALGGLWHGAGWNFVLWGVLHGLWMDLELVTEKARARWPKWLGLVITFHVVVFLWIPFRAPSIAALTTLLSRMTSAPWDINTPAQTAVMTLGFLALQKPLFALVRAERVDTLKPLAEVALAAAMVWLLLAYGSARQDFIYYVF
jgi:D-alanyl-lipoteichoic acid acyltransferase DltB (MBOAT superfamily)